MHSFPDHLKGCTMGSLVRFPLAAGGHGLGRIRFARGRLDDPHLGLALADAEGRERRDPWNNPIIVPVRASACRPAPDGQLADGRLAEGRAA